MPVEQSVRAHILVNVAESQAAREARATARDEEFRPTLSKIVNSADREARLKKERRFKRLNRITNTVAAAGLVVSLTGEGLSAYSLEHTLSGATARDYTHNNPNATPEQVSANSSLIIDSGAAGATVNGLGIAGSLLALELSRRVRRMFRENNS
jgi:hypothetical protein